MKNDQFERLMYLIGCAMRGAGKALIDESMVETEPKKKIFKIEATDTNSSKVDNEIHTDQPVKKEEPFIPEIPNLPELEITKNPLKKGIEKVLESVGKKAEEETTPKPRPMPKEKKSEPLVVKEEPIIKEKVSTANEEEVKPLVEKPKKKTKKTKPEPKEGTIEYWVAQLADRKALLAAINQYSLPIFTKRVREPSLRQGIIDCFYDPDLDFNPIERPKKLKQATEAPQVPENLDGPEEKPPITGGDFPMEMAKELVELFQMNSGNDGIEAWKEEKKCNLNCTECQAVLVRNCYASFLG